MTTKTFTDLESLGSVLVTGGCGFLGSHIVSLLTERYPPPKTNIAVLDLHTTRNTYPGVSYHSADVTDASAVRKVFQETKPDVVIHTASPVASSVHGAAARKKQEAFFRKVNVEGTRVLMEEARAAGVRVFVYTSSASVISDTRTDLLNADEKYELIRLPLQPEYYSDTKAEAEQLVLSSNARPTTTNPKPFLTTAIRPSAMFGEQDVQIIPNYLDVLRTGRTRFQLGENQNLFDFTYVGNTAHGHILAAALLLELSNSLKPTAEGEVEVEKEVSYLDDELRIDGRAFIITNHSPVYFWDFTRAVWAAYSALPSTNPKSTYNYKYSRPIVLSRTIALLIANLAAFFFTLLRLGAPKLTPTAVRYSCMTRYFKTRRAERALGYRPLWTLDEGIERTVKWFKEREEENGGVVEGKKDR